MFWFHSEQTLDSDSCSLFWQSWWQCCIQAQNQSRNWWLGRKDRRSFRFIYNYLWTRPEQDHKIEQFVVHPNYASFTHYFDIALIETQNDISFDEGVQPICLPSAPISYPDNRKNHKVEVAGFGFSSKEDKGLCTDYDNTQLRATTLSIYLTMRQFIYSWVTAPHKFRGLR